MCGALESGSGEVRAGGDASGPDKIPDLRAVERARREDLNKTIRCSGDWTWQLRGAELSWPCWLA